MNIQLKKLCNVIAYVIHTPKHYNKKRQIDFGGKKGKGKLMQIRPREFLKNSLQQLTLSKERKKEKLHVTFCQSVSRIQRFCGMQNIYIA